MSNVPLVLHPKSSVRGKGVFGISVPYIIPFIHFSIGFIPDMKCARNYKSLTSLITTDISSLIASLNFVITLKVVANCRGFWSRKKQHLGIDWHAVKVLRETKITHWLNLREMDDLVWLRVLSTWSCVLFLSNQSKISLVQYKRSARRDLPSVCRDIVTLCQIQKIAYLYFKSSNPL